MRKRVLIIDDEAQDSEIEELKRRAKMVGIDLECDQFNVGGSTEDDLLTDGAIDCDKVCKEAKKRFHSYSYNLIACDWGLSDDVYDGPELLRKLASLDLWKHSPKLFYSGLLNAKLEEKLTAFKDNNLDKNKLLSQIRYLINSDIKGSVDRGNQIDEIVTILKEEDSLDLIAENVLMKFNAQKFNGMWIHPSFKGQTYEKVLRNIQLDNHLKQEFKNELIEQCIAYLSENV